MPRFVDTNVLIYAVSSAPFEAEKQVIAQQILRSEEIVLSVQVLQEFYYQVTRLGRPGRLSHESAMLFVEELAKRTVHPVDIDLFRSASEISLRYQISYWDAAIIAAAAAMSCDVVYSEDLNPGQVYWGVRLINPFSST